MCLSIKHYSNITGYCNDIVNTTYEDYIKHYSNITGYCNTLFRAIEREDIKHYSNITGYCNILIVGVMKMSSNITQILQGTVTSN